MTIIEMAAELAKPNLRALGVRLIVLPGGRRAVIMNGEVLLAHVGMFREEVEIVKYRELWQSARASSAEEFASQIVVSGIAA